MLRTYPEAAWGEIDECGCTGADLAPLCAAGNGGLPAAAAPLAKGAWAKPLARAALQAPPEAPRAEPARALVHCAPRLGPQPWTGPGSAEPALPHAEAIPNAWAQQVGACPLWCTGGARGWRSARFSTERHRDPYRHAARHTL